MEVVTKSASETKKLAHILAKESLRTLRGSMLPHALIISLEGNLGSGKTTFAQGFAKGLGVKGKVLSPTFVLLKRYGLGRRYAFFHIDCYRLKRPHDLELLGFPDIVSDRHAVVLVEWGDRVRRLLPEHRLTIKLFHAAKHARRIVISQTFK